MKAGQHVFEGGAKVDVPKLTWIFKEKTVDCLKNADSQHEAFVKYE